ncbi:hypothetical protein FIBSPDRAFT_951141 [Athelia psychrophila]|uniref:Carbamoyl phosphate synthase ATP-binding domain-containing protein n=1 Tax=Athelia psychrophila TaxID=1759441 RepID=A0A166MVN7_9AGAM|nr:hypothetical protein FIBSPDRAFT_951141 [Fibularhizoctonia sp. CBS 109695]
MSPERIVDIAERTQSTHIHPAYGFFSESFAVAYLLSSLTPGRLNVTPLSPTRPLDEDGTGPFEYRANSQTAQWMFEINPRIQAEHTATEELANLDLVRVELRFSSATLASLDLTPASIGPRQGCSVQLRITVKNPTKDFHLSAGAIPAQLHRVAQGARGGTGVILRRPWVGRRASTLGIWVGIAGNAMQPSAIFHVVLSPPGFKVPSDAKKDTLALASIAHNTVPTHISWARLKHFLAFPARVLAEAGTLPLPASRLAHLISWT